MFDLPAGRISGRALKALVTSIRKTPARHFATKVLRAQLGIETLRSFRPEAQTALPLTAYPLRARNNHARPSEGLSLPTASLSTQRYTDAYKEGRTNPVAITERVLERVRKLEQLSPNMNPFCALLEDAAREAAEKSQKRYEMHQPLGPLDGILVPVKEEIDVAGLPTRLGTRWLPSTPVRRDAACVARLRQAGAIPIGHTVMTEYGLSPLGNNTFRSMPRNAHSRDRLAGGSSTGSAVAVALGLSPLAIGADGGGSIRVPAAFNGVFGLKPTFGRVPLTGQGMPWGSSVVHLGPIAGCTLDLALAVETMAGADAGDPASEIQPKLEKHELVDALRRGVKDLRIGVDEEQWARANDSVTRAARDALRALEASGATLVSVRSRLANHAAAIGYMTIGLEGFSAMMDVRERLDDVGLDVALTFAGLETFRPDDYLIAQRLRGELRRETAGILHDVDVIALPTAGGSPPPVTDAEQAAGFIDPPALDAACRFVFLANLTGLPAGSAPVGLDTGGLPVGLQLIGDAYDDAAVLQVMAHLERLELSKLPVPEYFVDFLS